MTARTGRRPPRGVNNLSEKSSQRYVLALFCMRAGTNFQSEGLDE